MRPIIRAVTASLLVMSSIVAACNDSTSPGNAPASSLRVSVSPKVDSVATGASTQLTARVVDDRNIPRDAIVAWRSEDPAIASVSATGVVAGVSIGIAHIVAQAGDGRDTATVVVRSARSLSVSPGAALVMLGDSLRLVASPTAEGTVAAASGANVRWASSDPAVATVSADGVMTTLGEGSVTISAQLGSVTGAASISVQRGSVGSVTVAPLNASILPGANLEVTGSVLDDNGRVVSGVALKWSSSNTAIATVDANGLVAGVAKGLAIITAQSKSRKATASVNVLDVPAATVSVSLGSGTLSVGQTTQATATVKDAQGTMLTGRTIAWQSSNPALATVDSKGLVTAITNGSVTISAICEAKVGSAPLTVSLPVPTSVVILPSKVSLTLGQATQLQAEVHDAKGAAIPNQVITWASANRAVAPITASGSVSAAAIGTTSVQASTDGLTTSAGVSVSSVTAASVAVVPTSLPLTTGDTATLSATVRDAAGTILTDRAVTWSSSNAAVATVALTGLVKATGAGSATISATADGISSGATVTVSAPAPSPVASVSVTLASAPLAVGATTQATAVLRDGGGNILTGRTVTWSSANTGVATVSATGLVSAIGAGSATIVATSENQSGGASLTVNTPAPAPVASVTLSAASTTLTAGSTLQVTVTLKDASGNTLTGRTIGWTSSNTGVAAVSPSGLVTGIGGGSVTITATSEGVSNTLPVTVSPAPVSSATVTLAATSIEAGQTTQAAVTLKDGAGNVLTGRSVTWSSSASGVATVSSAGVVTGLAVGTTTVVATSEGKSGSAMLTVTSPPPPPPPPPPPSGGSCSLVTGESPRATSALAKPGYLKAVIEPDFGTTITRITGDPGTPIPVVGGTWPTVAYGNYPKDPVWTADGKLLVLKHMSGALGAGWSLVLDGDTYQPLFKLGAPAGGGGEWRLHPTLPDIAVYLNPTTGAAGRWNIRTNVTTQTVAGVSGYTNHELGPSEGNISYDGRYLVDKAVRSSDSHVVARVIDVDGGATGPVIDLTAAGISYPGNLDWVSISAGGGYVVAYVSGTLDGGTNRLKVWSAKTGVLVQYFTDYTFGHNDLGLDAAGNEVVFGEVGQAPYAHHYVTRRLDTGAITDLTGAAVSSYNWHASVKATARRGWGLGVTNDITGYALDGEIYGIKLDGSRQIERYAHHRSVTSDYDANPFPTPSPDGKRILFSSNWGSSSARPIQTYIIDIRPICP